LFEGSVVHRIRGFWKQEGPSAREERRRWTSTRFGGHADAIGERMQQEVRNQVEVLDPRCPFSHPEADI